jgi:O-acetylserine/cysteine efflux transporter
VAPFTLLVPPVGIAAAWSLLGQSPSAGELAGASIILAGLALASSAMRIPRPVAFARRRSGIPRAGVVRSVDGD